MLFFLWFMFVMGEMIHLCVSMCVCVTHTLLSFLAPGVQASVVYSTSTCYTVTTVTLSLRLHKTHT